MSALVLLPQTTRHQLSIISKAVAELSTRPEFAHVTFAEVDISVEANAVSPSSEQGLGRHAARAHVAAK